MGNVLAWVRNILAVIGLIAIMAVIPVGICIWQLTVSPALEAKMDKFELTESEVASLAGSFDEEVMSITDKVENDNFTSGEPVAVTFTEEEVTAKLLDEIESSDISLNISDAWVNFAYDRDDDRYEIWILCKGDIGLELTAGLEFLVVAENGKPKIISEGDGLGLDIGEGPGIPEKAEHQVASALPTEEVLTDMYDNLPIYLSDVEIGDGEITFIGNFE